MIHRRIAIGLLAFPVGSCTGYCEPASLMQAEAVTVIEGRVADCSATTEVIRMSVRAESGSIVLAMPEANAPWPSEDYRTAVDRRYHLAGACPSVGDSVKVLYCGRCGVNGEVFAIEVVQGSSNGGLRRLWLYRQFFDELSKSADERSARTLVSRIITNYNRFDRGARQLWVRDTVENELDAYSSNERAKDMIARFGTEEMVSRIPPLRRIFDQYRSRIGLFRGIPYMPAGPLDAPFISAWPMFPVEISIEDLGGKLTRAYP